MNQLLINGKMSQGFGLKMKRKQQVEYKEIVSEVLEAGRVSGCVCVCVCPGCQNPSETCTSTSGWREGGLPGSARDVKRFNDSFVFGDLKIPANEATDGPIECIMCVVSCLRCLLVYDS